MSAVQGLGLHQTLRPETRNLKPKTGDLGPKDLFENLHNNR